MEFQKKNEELQTALGETWEVLHDLQVAHSRVLRSRSWRLIIFFRRIGEWIRTEKKKLTRTLF